MNKIPSNLFLYIYIHREVRALADKYNALVFLDECHASGFLGDGGRYVC